MKKIKCTLVENYKLTLGKEYEVGNESRDFYTIINDNGVGVRYSKRLFEEVEEEQVPPPPPARTERDVLNSITLNGTNIHYVDINNNEVRIPIRFGRSSSNISCGVSQIVGINNQIQEIDDHFDLEEDDFLTIRKALFLKSLEWVKESLNSANSAMGLLSTNVEGNDDGFLADEDMLSVLDEVCHTSSQAMVNPNSGRTIKTWIITRAGQE